MTSFYESRGIEPDVGALSCAHHSLSIRGPLPAETAASRSCAAKIVLRVGKRIHIRFRTFFSNLRVEDLVARR